MSLIITRLQLQLINKPKIINRAVCKTTNSNMSTRTPVYTSFYNY